MNYNYIFFVVIVCVLFYGSSPHSPHTVYYHAGNNYEEWLALNNVRSVDEHSIVHYEDIANKNFTIDEYYRNPHTHNIVADFFVQITGSEQIALPIMYHAEKNAVPFSLMFSIAWVESKYKPSAYNKNTTTIDRGLFQLNSASFYTLQLEEFFNPEINSLHAGKHVRYCLDRSAGDTATALAIYNAGLGRVRSGSIPESTQVYISRVLEYRVQLERRFESYIVREITRTQSTRQS